MNMASVKGTANKYGNMKAPKGATAAQKSATKTGNANFQKNFSKLRAFV